MCSPDIDNDDVPWVLGKLHHLQSFELGIGDPMTVKWNALCQPFQDALLCLIHLPSLSRLKRSHIYDFPTTILFPCMNLADLSLACVTRPTTVVSYENDCTVPEAAPQLQLFAFHLDGGSYAMHLLNTRHPNGVPVLDFSKVRTLSVEADREQDLMAIQAFIRVTKNLETLDYTSMWDPYYRNKYVTDNFS
jgi:hypothetical protein